MTDSQCIAVELVYALPDKQRLLALRVAPGSTARDVVRHAGLEQEFPELDIERCPLGVFGREVSNNYRVGAGDRVEVYRPLSKDPREARRELAAKGATMGPSRPDET